MRHCPGCWETPCACGRQPAPGPVARMDISAPLTMMAAVLASRAKPPRAPNPTAVMRAHLRDVGPTNSTELGALCGITPRLVCGLLDRSIRRGDVVRRGRLFCWAGPSDAAFLDAVRIVESRGYRVIARRKG